MWLKSVTGAKEKAAASARGQAKSSYTRGRTYEEFKVQRSRFKV